VLLNEGDDIQVALQEPLALPEIVLPPDTQNEIQAAGLNITLLDYRLGRDPFKVENQITLTLDIQNQTSHTFGSFDIGLVDEYGNAYSTSPFGANSMLVFRLEAQSQIKGQLSFSVKSPAVRHYLVFYKPYTREILAKISLTEALKHLSSKQKRLG
jgi:hypothetical protein